MKKIILPEGYKPSENEEYMNDSQLQYFKEKLLAWREQLIRDAENTLTQLQQESLQESDLGDRAALEAEKTIELRTRDRQRKLINKIDAALKRIDDGEYGYCEATGDQIGLKRLEARPVATLCIEAQEEHEKYERQHIDEDNINIES